MIGECPRLVAFFHTLPVFFPYCVLQLPAATSLPHQIHDLLKSLRGSNGGAAGGSGNGGLATAQNKTENAAFTLKGN